MQWKRCVNDLNGSISIIKTNHHHNTFHHHPSNRTTQQKDEAESDHAAGAGGVVLPGRPPHEYGVVEEDTSRQARGERHTGETAPTEKVASPTDAVKRKSSPCCAPEPPALRSSAPLPHETPKSTLQAGETNSRRRLSTPPLPAWRALLRRDAGCHATQWVCTALHAMCSVCMAALSPCVAVCTGHARPVRRCSVRSVRGMPVVSRSWWPHGSCLCSLVPYHTPPACMPPCSPSYHHHLSAGKLPNLSQHTDIHTRHHPSLSK